MGISVTAPSRDPPTKFAMWRSRLRGDKPKNTCLIVFERPNKDKPVVYRTYVNGKHFYNFTDIVMLLGVLTYLNDNVPNIYIYARRTRKHRYPYAEWSKVMVMLEQNIWNVEVRCAFRRIMPTL